MVSFCEDIAIPLKWHVPTAHAIWARGFIIYIWMLWTDNHAEQGLKSSACCNPASWGVCSASRHCGMSLLPMPFKQGVSSLILGSFGGSLSFQQISTQNKAWNGQLLRKALLFHSNGMSLLPMPFKQRVSSSILGFFGGSSSFQHIITQN